MTNIKKNQVSKNGSLTNGLFRALPIIAALAASGFIQPALAVDRTWFGSTGDWGVDTNWSPIGVPGISDKAIINRGNSTLSFNTGITGLDLSNGTLSGTGNLTLSGLSTWTRGTITGAATTTFNSTLNMSGDLTKVISGGRIVNADNTAWSGNTGANKNEISFGQGTFNNNGTFTDTNAFGDRMHSSGTFNNNGTYNKQNTTLTNIDTGVDFNNTGTVHVNAGILRLEGNGTHSGSFAMASGATLDFRFGTHNLNTVTTGGAGTFQISGGMVNLNGGSHTAHFLLSGGTLAGTTTPIDGAADWTRGTITGAATTTFNSTLNMSGDLTKVISGGRIVNADNTAWSGNTGANKNEISFGQGTFNNNGTFTDTNAFGDRMHSSGTFNNNGTYNKQNNTLTNIDTGVDFNNTGTGTLNVQGGVFNVANTMTNAGVVNVSAGAIFQSSCGGADCFSNTGIMQGNGTIQTRINNELVNSGAINPGDSIGHLTIDGDLHQAASGVVNFELASLSSFDQLTVTDDVTLGGDIALWNLGYTPVAGDSFVVATFDDRADTTFSSLSLHGFSPNTFQVFYHDHDVTVAVVPEPEQYLMLLAGLGLMGFVARRRRNGIRGRDETV